LFVLHAIAAVTPRFAASFGWLGFSINKIRMRFDAAHAAAALFIYLFCFAFQLSSSIVLFDIGVEL
jgi:hypothetical protein